MSIQEIRDYQLKKLDEYERPWLTVSECAYVLGVSSTSVRRALEYGELVGEQRKPKCSIRVTKVSICEYIRTAEPHTAF